MFFRFCSTISLVGLSARVADIQGRISFSEVNGLLDPSIKQYADSLYGKVLAESAVTARRESTKYLYDRSKLQSPNQLFSGVDCQAQLRIYADHIERSTAGRLDSYQKAFREINRTPTEGELREILNDFKATWELQIKHATQAVSSFLATRNAPPALDLPGSLRAASAHGHDRVLQEWKIWRSRVHLQKSSPSSEVAFDSTDGKAGVLAPDHSLTKDDSADRKFARMAVEEARKSVPENDGRPRPKVGAVVVRDGQVVCAAHRGEFLGNHAEYIALEKKARDLPLAGATVYTTLEPCTTRNHPKVPCAIRLVERKVARVVIGMLDPDTRITGKGQRQLRRANIITDLFPHDLMAEVEEMNREFTQFCERQQMPIVQNSVTPEVVNQMPSGMEDTMEAGDERDRGRLWVEGLLTRLLAERDLRLDSPIRWTPNFDREIYTMEARMGGTDKIWRLSYEALEDCVADKNVQRTIERALRMYFVPDTEGSSSTRFNDLMSEEEIVAALKNHQEGKKLDQQTLDILDRDGYISTSDVTNMQSTARELLVISITQKGLTLLARFKS